LRFTWCPTSIAECEEFLGRHGRSTRFLNDHARSHIGQQDRFFDAHTGAKRERQSADNGVAGARHIEDLACESGSVQNLDAVAKQRHAIVPASDKNGGIP
jgi:hypothetical protein